VDTPQAQRWRRGEGTGESDRENWRYWRNRFKNDAAIFSQLEAFAEILFSIHNPLFL
jgi:hypothetical protein